MLNVEAAVKLHFLSIRYFVFPTSNPGKLEISNIKKQIPNGNYYIAGSLEF